MIPVLACRAAGRLRLCALYRVLAANVGDGQEDVT